MDFTLKKYISLINALKECNPVFCGFSDIVSGNESGYVVLRHDIDRNPDNALVMARIEAEAGIKASYHFRVSEAADTEPVMAEISFLGHEIAYHYEDITSVTGRNGIAGVHMPEEIVYRAFNRFQKNLDYLRKFSPVNVISMHGSPLARIDNRLLWKYYDYHSCGIICEPYFDIDVTNVLYLTDTGRRWDADGENLRDRGIYSGQATNSSRYSDWKTVPRKGSMMDMTSDGSAFRASYIIRHTDEIIYLAHTDSLPDRLIINTHPQRWTDSVLPWVIESISQGIKNQIKIALAGTKFYSRALLHG
jgi:hypothetical protein